MKTSAYHRYLKSVTLHRDRLILFTNAKLMHTSSKNTQQISKLSKRFSLEKAMKLSCTLKIASRIFIYKLSSLARFQRSPTKILFTEIMIFRRQKQLACFWNWSLNKSMKVSLRNSWSTSNFISLTKFRSGALKVNIWMWQSSQLAHGRPCSRKISSKTWCWCFMLWFW